MNEARNVVSSAEMLAIAYALQKRRDEGISLDTLAVGSEKFTYKEVVKLVLLADTITPYVRRQIEEENIPLGVVSKYIVGLAKELELDTKEQNSFVQELIDDGVSDDQNEVATRAEELRRQHATRGEKKTPTSLPPEAPPASDQKTIPNFTHFETKKESSMEPQQRKDGTLAKIEKIYAEYREGKTPIALSKQYGIGRSTLAKYFRMMEQVHPTVVQAVLKGEFSPPLAYDRLVLLSKEAQIAAAAHIMKHGLRGKEALRHLETYPPAKAVRVRLAKKVPEVPVVVAQPMSNPNEKHKTDPDRIVEVADDEAPELPPRTWLPPPPCDVVVDPVLSAISGYKDLGELAARLENGGMTPEMKDGADVYLGAIAAAQALSNKHFGRLQGLFEKHSQLS